VKESQFYSFHLDEGTKIASQQHISVFIRCVSNDEVFEDLIFCKALQLHAKCENIFPCLGNFFS